MVLANLYLLCWHYDKIKYIFLWNNTASRLAEAYSNSFPAGFFMGVAAAIIAVSGVVIAMNRYAVMPRNRLQDCKKQFEGTAHSREGYVFCECIYSSGGPLAQCLEAYEKALLKSEVNNQ